MLFEKRLRYSRDTLPPRTVGLLSSRLFAYAKAGRPNPTQEGWGMFVRLLGKLLLKRMNIPLRHSAFATRRCPPSKGELLELRLDLIILSKSMK